MEEVVEGAGVAPSRSTVRDVVEIVLLATAYALLGRLGLTLAYYQQHATLIWAPAGLSVAAVWLRGVRILPGVFLGALITNLSIGSSPPLALGIACGNAAEALVAWTLVRKAGLETGLRDVRRVVLFLGLVVFVSTAIAALNGVGWLVVLAHLPLKRVPPTALIWWLGDAGGVLVATPLLLAFARPQVRMGGRLSTEVVLLVIFSALTLAVAFGGLVPISWIRTPIVLLPFPALAWAAMRFGMRGATIACAAVWVAAVGGTVAGTGPFRYGNVHLDVAMLWLFLATLSVSAMLLAASLEERTREAVARQEGEQWLGIALGAAEAVAFERDLAKRLVRARSASGQPRSWVRDADWEDSIHPDDRAAVREAIAECVRNERDTWDVEYRLIGEGPPCWVLERGRVVERDADQRGRLAFGLRRDVTELRRAAEERHGLERELERSKRLGELGMLAGGIAHDFNNLLAVVRANVELGRARRDPEVTREAFDAIDEAAGRAAELTSQLLAYAGRRPMQRRDVDLAALAAETARMLSRSLPEHVRVDLDLPATALYVSADPAQLRQILMNLVLNAAESIDGGKPGTIRVRVASDRGSEGEPRVLLEVRDDGHGMDRDTVARVFEPFFTTKSSGRGLGMAAVLGVVRAHGGTIDVESEPRRGTTFRVRFPATDRADVGAAAHPESSVPPAKNGARNVLVVDDEPGIRSVARLLLEGAGWRVEVAADAAEAFDRFSRCGPFDVALIDLKIPGTSGAEIMDALRARAPRLPVVLMSGYSEDLLEGSRLAGTPFLSKPFREAELLARLEAATTSPSHRTSMELGSATA
ncbi:MAG: MASE1 domain-containing protein [Polyangiales bacterium]